MNAHSLIYALMETQIFQLVNCSKIINYKTASDAKMMKYLSSYYHQVSFAILDSDDQQF